jgi:phage terminase Nu1 subunit (DNA packaging protein)
MSREHIDHLKETLASRVEKVEEEDEEVSTKGEASQEPRKADVAP